MAEYKRPTFARLASKTLDIIWKIVLPSMYCGILSFGPIVKLSCIHKDYQNFESAEWKKINHIELVNGG